MRCRYSSRSSSRLADEEFEPGSNWRSHTKRVTRSSAVSSSNASNCSRIDIGSRLAILVSMRRSASTRAAAQSRSIVDVAGRTVRVRRHSATKRRAISSFDTAISASRNNHSFSSLAPRPEKVRKP
nr:hypothetical protein [Aeromonas allosaccharophila]